MLGHNLALWKPTKQSSTPNPKYASINAVDGIASVLLRRGSCAHTEAAVGSWWQVDLNGMYEIRELTITTYREGMSHDYRLFDTTTSSERFACLNSHTHSV